MPARNKIYVVLWAGLLVGTLDITAAMLRFAIETGRDPRLVLRYIASAIFNKKAYGQHNETMVIAGLLIHFFIAYIFTLLFFLAYPKITRKVRNWLLTGIAYGIFTWLLMNLAVLPLTSLPRSGAFDPWNIMMGALILVAAMGIPLSLIARRHFSQPRI